MGTMIGGKDHDTILAGTEKMPLSGNQYATVSEVANYGVVPANTQSGTTYTLVLADTGHVVRLTNASAATATVPPSSSVAFPVGAVVAVYAAGAAGVTIAPGSGVTIRNNVSSLIQYQEVSLRKDGTDEWVRLG